MLKKITIATIRRHNNAAGFHFFDPDTVRFFNSTVSPRIHSGCGGVFFVTSEAFDPQGVRRYTVRQYCPDTGHITTPEVETPTGRVGGFWNIETATEAHHLAKAFATVGIEGLRQGEDREVNA